MTKAKMTSKTTKNMKRTTLNRSGKRYRRSLKMSCELALTETSSQRLPILEFSSQAALSNCGIAPSHRGQSHHLVDCGRRNNWLLHLRPPSKLITTTTNSQLEVGQSYHNTTANSKVTIRQKRLKIRQRLQTCLLLCAFPNPFIMRTPLFT